MRSVKWRRRRKLSEGERTQQWSTDCSGFLVIGPCFDGLFTVLSLYALLLVSIYSDVQKFVNYLSARLLFLRRLVSQKTYFTSNHLCEVRPPPQTPVCLAVAREKERASERERERERERECVREGLLGEQARRYKKKFR